jgi:hypothetical protein
MDLVAGVGTEDARRDMRRRFRASGGLSSPEHYIDVMVESIREVSRTLPNTVGADCMAVHIQPSSPRVTVVYKPARLHHAIVDPSGTMIGP